MKLKQAACAVDGLIMTTDDMRETSDASIVVAIGRYHQEALGEACRRHAGRRGAPGLLDRTG